MIRFLSFFLLYLHTCFCLEPQPDGNDEWTAGLYEIIDQDHTAKSRNSSESDEQGVERMLRSKDDLVVEFMLYTKDNTENYTLLIPEDESSLKQLNLKKPLKMIIHGWRNGFDSPLGEILKDAYLGKRRRKLFAQDVNVIVLDWSSKSFNNYIGSRMNVPKVADEVVRLLEGLVKLGLDLDNVHLIGHSLGAHIAGIAGNRMKSGQIARVTGLDPAAPMFTLTEEDILKPFSAKFVDVIHTCGYLLGFLSPLGHADFYPNKGTPAQPGCGFDYKGECSHSRAYELYAETIDSKDMLAISCGDVTHFEERRCYDLPPTPMGEHCPPTARGLFFLNTNRKTPYARGTKF